MVFHPLVNNINMREVNIVQNAFFFLPCVFLVDHDNVLILNDLNLEVIFSVIYQLDRLF